MRLSSLCWSILAAPVTRICSLSMMMGAIACTAISPQAIASSSDSESFRIPPLTRPVHDEAQVLPTAIRAELEGLLNALHQSGSAQIAVLIVDQLGGLAIEQASLKVAEQWKLGDAKLDNGALLMVAMKERRIRIEVGQGLEGVLTDARSSRIIREWMRPQFRAGRPEEGIRLGVLAVIQLVRPETLEKTGLTPSKLRKAQRDRQQSKELIFLLIFFGVSVLIFRKQLRGHSISPIGYQQPWSHRSGGFGGLGGFGGGRSGGFGGFGGGGGGFSGGGASGGW